MRGLLATLVLFLFFLLLESAYCIEDYVTDSLDEEDRMVVLCHELGHAILHQTKEVNFMKKNFIYYSNALENEANEFAREILKYQYHSYVYSDCMLLNEILR